MKNAYIERKIGSMRRELLNAYIFHRLSEVWAVSEQWCIDYNTERPIRLWDIYRSWRMRICITKS
ncbi:MAG: transposase [Chitinophaga sp.]|nr:transposase [Chitinophaga sp.]